MPRLRNSGSTIVWLNTILGPERSYTIEPTTWSPISAL